MLRRGSDAESKQEGNRAGAQNGLKSMAWGADQVMLRIFELGEGRFAEVLAY